MEPMFKDRLEAAKLLARRLIHLSGRKAIIAGIPRGAVQMAAEIASSLGGELDIVLVHKIGHPMNPEMAVAAVDESGHIFRYDGFDLSDSQLASLAQPEVDHLTERRLSYARVRPPGLWRGRTVVLVDDGIATGATMLAAIASARARGARHVIAAAPVASRESMSVLDGQADEIAVLFVPRWLGSIGSFYHQFDEVSDSDVLDALRKRTRPAPEQTISR